jgi:predicted 2-oxoglutarate/Fe(II)-dependent dioxygenase YbiX
LTKQDIALADTVDDVVVRGDSGISDGDGDDDIDTEFRPLRDYVVATLEQLYQQPIHMDRNQPHVVKYDAHHTSVPLHYDHCAITVNLSLNDYQVGDYTGGGTYLADLHDTVRLRRGEFLIHPGRLLHGGCPITSGTRYILVFFCQLGGSGGHYCRRRRRW